MSVCGTGNGNFPQPGDPNLDGPVLSVQSGFKGIAVSWTYPAMNPHAVAHTLLFRSTGSSFAGAVQIRVVTGNYHFDQEGLVEGTLYYYWIQLVSVHGTVGNVIGPASAVLQPSMEEIIAQLTDQVTNSQLHADLKTEIAKITTIASGLTTEQQERLLGDDTLSQLVALLEQDLADIDTLVASETLQRTTDNSALVAQVNLILAKANDNAAAIQQEQLVRATEDSAIALQVDTLQGVVNDDIASLQTLQAVVVGPGGLSAQWMVKTDVNGYVSGFGLYNDGATSQFIVRADLFAVGLAGESDAYPFIIGSVNGVPQIVLNAATLIPDATIGNAMIGNYIQSNNYNPATGVGWRIDKGGWANFNAITIRDAGGNVILSSGTGMEWSHISGTGKPANNATVGAPNGTYVGSQLAQDVAGSTTVVNDMSADNILTPSEKYTLRRQWDALKEEADRVSAAGAAVSVSYAALTTNLNSLGTLLHGSTWTSASGVPLYINDSNLGTTTSIAGSTLRIRWKNVVNNIGYYWDLVNRANVNVVNPITAATASTYISNLAVNTLQIANNAVTVPTSIVWQPSIATARNISIGSAWLTVGTLDVTWGAAVSSRPTAVSVFFHGVATQRPVGRAAIGEIVEWGVRTQTLLPSVGSIVENTAGNRFSGVQVMVNLGGGINYSGGSSDVGVVPIVGSIPEKQRFHLSVRKSPLLSSGTYAAYFWKGAMVVLGTKK